MLDLPLATSGGLEGGGGWGFTGGTWGLSGCEGLGGGGCGLDGTCSGSETVFKLVLIPVNFFYLINGNTR